MMEDIPEEEGYSWEKDYDITWEKLVSWISYFSHFIHYFLQNKSAEDERGNIDGDNYQLDLIKNELSSIFLKIRKNFKVFVSYFNLLIISTSPFYMANPNCRWGIGENCSKRNICFRKLFMFFLFCRYYFWVGKIAKIEQELKRGEFMVQWFFSIFFQTLFLFFYCMVKITSEKKKQEWRVCIWLSYFIFVIIYPLQFFAIFFFFRLCMFSISKGWFA